MKLITSKDLIGESIPGAVNFFEHDEKLHISIFRDWKTAIKKMEAHPTDLEIAFNRTGVRQFIALATLMVQVMEDYIDDPKARAEAPDLLAINQLIEDGDESYSFRVQYDVFANKTLLILNHGFNPDDASTLTVTVVPRAENQEIQTEPEINNDPVDNSIPVAGYKPDFPTYTMKFTNDEFEDLISTIDKRFPSK